MGSLTRRALLRNTAAVALAVPLGAGVLASCSSEPSPEEVLAGRLVELANAATVSASTARELASAEPRPAAALGEIAGIRDEHATLLRDEVARLNPSSLTMITSTSASATPEQSPTPAQPASGLDAFRAGLASDAAAARQVATTASGFQAGLTASVAASITSLSGLLS